MREGIAGRALTLRAVLRCLLRIEQKLANPNVAMLNTRMLASSPVATM